MSAGMGSGTLLPLALPPPPPPLHACAAPLFPSLVALRSLRFGRSLLLLLCASRLSCVPQALSVSPRHARPPRSAAGGRRRRGDGVRCIGLRGRSRSHAGVQGEHRRAAQDILAGSEHTTQETDERRGRERERRSAERQRAHRWSLCIFSALCDCDAV